MHMRAIAFVLFVCLTVMLSQSVIAKSAYITDRVSIGIFPDISLQGQPVKTLPTGTILEVLVQQDGYTQVRTRDNVTGWLASKYLSDERPAQLDYLKLVSEHKLAQDKLRDYETRLLDMQELKQQARSSGDLQAKLNEFKARESKLELDLKNKQMMLAESQMQRDNLQKEVFEVKSQLKEVLQSIKIQAEQGGSLDLSGLAVNDDDQALDSAGTNMQAIWLISGLVLTLITGVFLGYLVMDYRSRRKHGGIRLY